MHRRRSTIQGIAVLLVVAGVTSVSRGQDLLERMRSQAEAIAGEVGNRVPVFDLSHQAISRYARNANLLALSRQLEQAATDLRSASELRIPPFSIADVDWDLSEPCGDEASVLIALLAKPDPVWKGNLRIRRGLNVFSFYQTTAGVATGETARRTTLLATALDEFSSRCLEVFAEMSRHEVAGLNVLTLLDPMVASASGGGTLSQFEVVLRDIKMVSEEIATSAAKVESACQRISVSFQAARLDPAEASQLNELPDAMAAVGVEFTKLATPFVSLMERIEPVRDIVDQLQGFREIAMGSRRLISISDR